MMVLIQTQEVLIAPQNQKIRNSLESKMYNLGYSGEKTREELGWISPERVEKIENGKMAHSDEVLAISIRYIEV